MANIFRAAIIVSLLLIFSQCGIHKRHDAEMSVIDWPDDRPIRIILVYDSLDTWGNKISPRVKLQWQQFSKNATQPFATIGDGRLSSTKNYALVGDTAVINIWSLMKINPVKDGSYVYMWRFRIRLENRDDRKKFSDWVYSNPIRLFRADREFGFPVNPKQIRVIF